MINRLTSSLMLLVFSLTGLISPLNAQPDTVWTRTYGGNGNDVLLDIQADSSDGFFVVGYTNSFGAGDSDGWLLHIDSLGDTLWTRTYGDTAINRLYALELTDDGGYVLAGSMSYTTPDYNYDAWIVRIAANGDTLWTRTYGGNGHQSVYCIESTGDGGFIMGGEWHTGDDPQDAWLVRIDSNGDTLWTRCYGGDGYDEIRKIRHTSDGGFVMVGYNKPSATERHDTWLVRIDNMGDTLWTRTFAGPYFDAAWDVACTADGGFIIAGDIDVSGYSNTRGRLIRTDADGHVLWENTYHQGGSATFSAVQPAANGGFIIAGTSFDYRIGSKDGWLVYTDSVGQMIRAPTYGGSALEKFNAFQSTIDGGFILVGGSGYYDSTGFNGWLVRTQYVENISPGPFSLLNPPIDSIMVRIEDSIWDTVTFAWTSAIDTDDDSVLYILETSSESGALFPPLVYTIDTSTSLIPNFAFLLKSMALDTFHVNWDVSAWDTKGGYARASNGPGTFTFIFEYVGDVEDDEQSDIPKTYTLHPAYPNPFNPSTTLRYELPHAAQVTLTIYDLLGREVATLVDDYIQPGTNEIAWDAGSHPSGIYLARFATPGYSKTIKLVLLR